MPQEFTPPSTATVDDYNWDLVSLPEPDPNPTVVDPLSTGNLAAPGAPATLTTLATYLNERGTGSAGSDFWDEFYGTSTNSPFFNVTGSGTNAKNGVIHYNVTSFPGTDANGVTAGRADMIRHALNVYEDILGINFVETTSTNTSYTDLFFGDWSAGKAFANFNKASDGSISYAWVNIDNNWDSGNTAIGTYAFQTALHEIGHTLGLGHQGLYNAGSGSPTYNDAYWQNDTWQQTMMSYWDQSNYNSQSYARLIGPMAVDWLALDRIYGAQGYGISNGTTTGDTTWGFNDSWYNWTPSSSGPGFGYANSAFASMATMLDTNAVAIVDGGGTDTLDLSGFSNNTVIDVSEALASSTTGSISSVAGLTGNLTIAVGTIIENVIGGAGSELIYGNNANNTIDGNGGNDTIYGYDGNDRLEGGTGDDKLYGGVGNDTFYYLGGVTGNDSLSGAGGYDKILVEGAGSFDLTGLNVSSIEEIEYKADGTNIDKTVTLSNKEIDSTSEFASALVIDGNSNTGSDDVLIINFSTSYGQHKDFSNWVFQDWGAQNEQVIINGSSNANTITGTDVDDQINGNGGNDRLSGWSGNDTLSGGSGIDTLYGGTGNDTLLGGWSTDTLYGGSGNDTMKVLSGEYFDNVYGGTGTDTLDHTAVSRSGDTFDFELGQIVSGFDTGTPVLSSIEVYRDGTGGNTIISGGDGATFYGNAGDDTMHAGLGTETMYGGSGTDTLDTTTFNGAYEVDMTTGLTNYGGELFLGFENLISGNGNDTLTGTSGINSIVGGGGNDTISGGGGEDSLDGGAGIDTADYSYWGGVGGVFDLTAGTALFSGFYTEAMVNFENLIGSGGGDSISGTSGVNILNGGAGNDTISGGGGEDSLDGGAGIDTADYRYWTGVGGVFDLTAGTALFAGFYTEAMINFENLFGSGGNDSITGTSGANTLSGGAGNDTIQGGAGVDVMNGNGGNDTFIIDYGWTGGAGESMNGGTGSDTFDTSAVGAINAIVNLVAGTFTYTPGGAGTIALSSIENVITGAGNDSVTGNSSANALTGGSGSDTLVGRGGDDTLIGGGGNDTLYGNGGADHFSGGAGDDVLYLGAGDVLKDGTVPRDIGGSGYDTAILATGFTFNPSNWSRYGIESVFGSSANDTIRGRNNGVDYHFDGGDGNDTLLTAGGDDTLVGGAGNDTLNGGAGADHLTGGAGDDVIYLGAGDVLKNGTVPRDIGGTGYDTAILATGFTFNPSNWSRYGFESVFGSSANDTMRGRNNGVDYHFDGGGGTDTLSTVGGDDTLVGGAGNDMLTSGAGADRFVYNTGAGTDTITDFEDGVDLVEIVTGAANFGDLTIVDGIGGAVVTFSGVTIVLTGMVESDLTASDFLFT
ncbi:MAG: M10 family metallopeptidase C-terminal domain-containing protein [Rhodobacteraceae bacterium]|nr:M10 family metallopeptidase C-terminal domain-containing protein [Paracoccaceae bacterium]